MLKARFLLPDAASTVCIIRLCSGEAKTSGVKQVFRSTFWIKTLFYRDKKKRRSNGDSLAKMKDKIESLRGRQMHTLWREK